MCTKCFQYFLAHRKHIKWTNKHMGRINNNLRLIFLLFRCVNCLMDYGQWLEPFQSFLVKWTQFSFLNLCMNNEQWTYSSNLSNVWVKWNKCFYQKISQNTLTSFEVSSFSFNSLSIGYWDTLILNMLNEHELKL